MTDTRISADLLRGHTDTMILRLLCEADRYGYEIVKLIAERPSGRRPTRLQQRQCVGVSFLPPHEKERYPPPDEGRMKPGRRWRHASFGRNFPPCPSPSLPTRGSTDWNAS